MGKLASLGKLAIGRIWKSGEAGGSWQLGEVGGSWHQHNMWINCEKTPPTETTPGNCSVTICIPAKSDERVVTGAITCCTVLWFITFLIASPYLFFGIPLTLPSYGERVSICGHNNPTSTNECFSRGWDGGSTTPGRNNVSCIFCKMTATSKKMGSNQKQTRQICTPVDNHALELNNQATFNTYAENKCYVLLKSSTLFVHGSGAEQMEIRNASQWMSLLQYNSQKNAAVAAVKLYNQRAPTGILVFGGCSTVAFIYLLYSVRRDCCNQYQIVNTEEL